MKLLKEKIADFQKRGNRAKKKANKIKKISERIMKEHKLSTMMEKRYLDEEKEGIFIVICFDLYLTRVDV